LFSLRGAPNSETDGSTSAFECDFRRKKQDESRLG